MANTISIERQRGLSFKLSILPSDQVPVSANWDFGDGNNSSLLSPTHTYPDLGTYIITLTVPGEENPVTITETLVISTKTSSMVPLLDISKEYIPSVLETSFSNKGDNLKEKWLLYLQPLVNHIIPDDNYYLEEQYEALEIRLAGELVAYDFLLSEVTKNIAGVITSSTGDLQSPDGDGEVKKITTGPTDAEFFSATESAAKITKALSELDKPGGVMDGLRVSICQLANRLQIYLPMCSLPKAAPQPFEIVRRD